MPTAHISNRILFSVLALCSLASAQTGTPYHSGKLLQMESVQCVVESTAVARKAAESCQEYVLQGEGVLFHLQSKSSHRDTLLPVGKSIEYRLVDGQLYLKVNGRDRGFSVVAMEPFETRQPVVHSAQTINHLQ